MSLKKTSPNAHIEEQGRPQGYSWYGDELISNRPSRYTSEEQTEILDTHPFFTGVCPQCRHEFDKDNLPVHFDCPNCDFVDDSESAIALLLVVANAVLLISPSAPLGNASRVHDCRPA